MLSQTRVAVVVPCYQAGRHIAEVVRSLPAFVDDIVVVDDGSPTPTAEALDVAADRRVVVIRHDVNRGLARAMGTGYAAALQRGAHVVVKMDGDGQMDPAYLPAILAPLLDHRADMVKCNRYSSLAHVRQMPLVRLFGNAGLTFLVKMASGYWNTFDPANGYLAVRATVLERIDLERLPRRYYFESGFLVELGILRAAVIDVPTKAVYGEENSSLSVTRTLLEFPPRLLAGFVRRVFWRYYVHDFSAVSVFLLLGVPLFLAGSVLGCISYYRYASTGHFAPAGLVMLAALPIFVGFQLIIQAIVLDVQNVPRVPISPPL